MTRERRLAFGEVAEQYDRVRPSYPEALVDDVLEFARLGRGGRALEVGAGTGKATLLFARRGVAVHALEPSVEMARVARRNLATCAQVTIEQREFEHATVATGSYGLVFSAQAWHWTAPESRYARARAALVDGGGLAVFWNRPRWEDSPLRDALEAVYEHAAPNLRADAGPMQPHTGPPPQELDDWRQEFDRAPEFADAETRTYPWTQDYAAAAYVELLETHSDHIVLGDLQRRVLLEGVRRLIDAHGGTISVNYETLLCMARAAE